jgi:hypothetical protein
VIDKNGFLSKTIQLIYSWLFKSFIDCYTWSERSFSQLNYIVVKNLTLQMINML